MQLYKKERKAEIFLVIRGNFWGQLIQLNHLGHVTKIKRSRAERQVPKVGGSKQRPKAI